MFGGLGNTREFASISRQPGNPLHLSIIENQQHEHVVGHFPFAPDSMIARGCEAESWIEVRVADKNDEWAARLFESSVSNPNQPAADALPLVFRKYCHRAQRCSRHGTDRHGAVDDVTNHVTIQYRDQRKLSGSVRPQSVDDLAFQVLTERAAVQITNSHDVIRALVTNFDQGVRPVCLIEADRGCPGTERLLPGAELNATESVEMAGQARLTDRRFRVGDNPPLASTVDPDFGGIDRPERLSIE